jgi:hypothetical protein
MALLPWHASAQVDNGFDLTDSLIPAREIHYGGQPRDGIPALTNPTLDDARVADVWLDDDDRVIGVAFDGAAVAYPIRILNWHEVVNDIVGERAIVVTYCPLCGTGLVFDAMHQGRRMKFGVSGLLYNSDVLLFDRDTNSLISQLMMKGISGPLRGVELSVVPAETTSWAAWKKRHPQTQVLSWATGFQRDYEIDPYRRYSKTRRLMYPVKGANRSRGHKEWAWLVLLEDRELLIAEDVLPKRLEDNPGMFRTHGVLLRYDRVAKELTATANDEDVVVVPGYWFALTAFYPDAILVGEDDLEASPD